MLRWVLALLLPACAAPPESEAVSPYEHPPYGGCTVTQVESDPSGERADVVHAWAYDDEERSAAYTYTYRDYTYEVAWSYDAEGCLTDYTETTEEPDFYGLWEERYACADGLPVSATVTETETDEEPRVRTYTFANVVEQGLLVLRTVVEDDGSTWRQAYSWADGELVAHDSWYGQRWEEHETWTRDEEGRVLTYQAEDPSQEWVLERSTYTLDAHGRVVEWRYGEGEDWEADLLVETRTWQEDRYSPSRVEVDSYADGVPDIVYDYDCAGDWPWSCTIEIDSAWESPDTVLDGEPDARWTYAWTCP